MYKYCTYVSQHADIDNSLHPQPCYGSVNRRRNDESSQRVECALTQADALSFIFFAIYP